MNYDELHIASSTKFSNNEKVLIQRTAQAIYYQSYLGFRYILPYRKRYKKSLALKFDLLKLLERETAEYFLLHPSIRSIG